MANSTQLRLQQITGSIGDLKPSSLSAGSAAASAAASDMVDVMKYYAQAIANIHGDADFGAQTIGQIEHADNNVLLSRAGSGGGRDLVIRTNIGSDADALKFSQVAGSGAGGHLILIENTPGNALDAIKLNAAAGGIDIQAALSSEIGLADGALLLDLDGTDSADGLVVDSEGKVEIKANTSDDGAIVLDAEANSGKIVLQKNSAPKFVVSGSVNESYDVLAVLDQTEATSGGQGALTVAGGGYFAKDIQGAADLELRTSNSAITIGSAGMIKFAEESGVGVLKTMSSTNLMVSASNGSLRLKSGGSNGTDVEASAASLGLSGSKGVEFVTDGGFSGTWTYAQPRQQGLVMMDDAQEAVDYRDTHFSATTSILGALNSLKASITSAEPTLFERTLTGSFSSAITAGLDITNNGTAVGDLSTLAATVAPNKAEVYVNGQLLKSGSSSAVSGGTADYHIPTDNHIKFGFDLVRDDVVKVLDRS